MLTTLIAIAQIATMQGQAACCSPAAATCCNPPTACCAKTVAEVAPDEKALECALRAEPASKLIGKIDYAGVRYGFCCAGCLGSFPKSPAKAIEAAAKANRTIGVALHDPATGLRIDAKSALGGSIDSMGTRYLFATEEGRKRFEADKTLLAAPKKEVLYCSVMKHGLPSYAAAGAYADYNEVRYYFCCGDCLKQFRANPSAYAEAVAGKVSAPKAMNAPKEKP